MNYQTYPPSESLSPFVKCFWTLRAPAEDIPQKQRIIPDGCMEMIFHLGDHFVQYSMDSERIIQPKSFVFGQITTPLDIEPTGVTDIFAVRFHVEGFRPFCTIPFQQMENRAVPFLEIFGEDGMILSESVMSKVLTEDRIRVVEEFLFSRLDLKSTIDVISKDCVNLIYELKGQGTVKDVSEELKVNRRSLERKLSESVGLSPKQLAKIVRMQGVLNSLLLAENPRFTDIAYEGEFYDQAHFIKDFKEFTGQSPKHFYSDNLKMSLLFQS